MKEEKIKALKELVSSHFEINIDSKLQNYPYIKARALAYTLLREQCLMSYTNIGLGFKKSHATIIHAIKEFPFMRKFDAELERDYETLRALWIAEQGGYDPLKPLQIKKELNDLREQNKMLNLSLIDVHKKFENRLKEIESQLTHAKSSA